MIMTQRGVPQRIRYRYFGAGGRKKGEKIRLRKRWAVEISSRKLRENIYIKITLEF